MQPRIVALKLEEEGRSLLSGVKLFDPNGNGGQRQEEEQEQESLLQKTVSSQHQHFSCKLIIGFAFDSINRGENLLTESITNHPS